MSAPTIAPQLVLAARAVGRVLAPLDGVVWDAAGARQMAADIEAAAAGDAEAYARAVPHARLIRLRGRAMESLVGFALTEQALEASFAAWHLADAFLDGGGGEHTLHVAIRAGDDPAEQVADLNRPATPGKESG